MSDTGPPTVPQPPLPRPPAWRRWAVRTLVLVALWLVFTLYGNPDFMVMLADQIWACF